ncbi:hypothetical protein P7228_14380 [Altererythrobacter arenosus]|uniref:Uncharacterized protein n=1 Tax=Altererythrobacter arenosus TaxID=3032592 RepID=A0ABY8FUT7_9SPHN|nr:hypothetical protein [Altererythrobacter sp. CAU 1644]WFL77161.1 hypothetical protein P7228_14380 [Altererythrobacter sp. CAU 1644]
MKRWIALASVAALAACSEAEAPAPEPTEEVVEVPMAVDGGPLAGSYATTDSNGGKAVWTLAEDGTFTLAADGADPVTGTYSNTPGDDGATFCADPEGDDAGETCFAISNPAEDGTWTATDPDGNVLTVSRSEG